MITQEAFDRAKAHGWTPRSPDQPWQVTAFEKAFWKSVFSGHHAAVYVAAAQFFMELALSGADMEKAFWKDHLDKYPVR